MDTFLMTWKPSEWGMDELKKVINEFNQGQTEHRWSCGTSTNLPVGSRVFLMRQGKGQCGIFGSGKVSCKPFKEEHYNEAKRAKGVRARFVMVDFDSLFEPPAGIKITRQEFLEIDPKFPNSQGSGKRIPPDIARALEDLWATRTGTRAIPYPDELDGEETYFEGAKKTVVVNSYERCPEAREKCLRHWGPSCRVCGFNFHYFYGEIGRGYIHVHHLKPLSEIGEGYKVNPVDDLRPVCPNCHAMLHREKPPLSIEELSARVRLYRNGS